MRRGPRPLSEDVARSCASPKRCRSLTPAAEWTAVSPQQEDSLFISRFIRWTHLETPKGPQIRSTVAAFVPPQLEVTMTSRGGPGPIRGGAGAVQPGLSDFAPI